MSTQPLGSLHGQPTMENLTTNTAIDPERFDRLITHIKDYQITHGFLLKIVRLEQPTTVPCRPVNVSILPTHFPKTLFEEAIDLQDLYTDLYARASSDPDWLHAVLGPLLENDGSIVRALWDIWEKVRQAGVVQDVVCGIFRSDYMLHQASTGDPVVLKQVEMNTVSVAGACHAERAADLHSHLKRMEDLTTIRQQRLPLQDEAFLPLNDNMLALTSALKAAHSAYTPTTSHPTCVLMIVQPDNFNIADERPLEYGLWDESIPCYRCEWPDVLTSTTLTQNRTLLFQHSFEVSLVYYRAGHQAHEYTDPAIRLRLELSRAIKCPDVLTHLTTFKSVQAALTSEHARTHFSICARLVQTFMPMMSTPNPNLIKDPTDWVPKPNLEGGDGHGSDIPAQSNFTFQRRIHPPPTSGTLMLPDQIYQGPVVSELGILGTCLWRRNAEGGVEVLRKETAGWTFKTKPADVEGMNVVKGHGCFDCPLLV